MLKATLDDLAQGQLNDSLAICQAKILQYAVSFLIIISILDLLYMLIFKLDVINVVLDIGSLVTLVITLFLSLYLLKIGKLIYSVILLSVMLQLAISAVFIGTTIIGQEVFLMACVIPIVLAGLLLDRIWLIVFTVSSFIMMLVVAYIELQRIPIEQEHLQLQVYTNVFGFIILLGTITAIVDRFGNTLRSTIRVQQLREIELEQISQKLETAVTERTADLQLALEDSVQRERELLLALDQIDQQRDTIRQLSVPIIPVSEKAMVMPLVGELDEDRLEIMTQQALRELTLHNKSRLIVDVTGVTIFDHKVAECLLNMINAIRLIGSDAVIVGIRPELAQTIVSTGVLSSHVRTERSLQALLT